MTFKEIALKKRVIIAAIMLLPEKLVKEMWPRTKDVSQTAGIFDVPKPVMYFDLRAMSLV